MGTSVSLAILTRPINNIIEVHIFAKRYEGPIPSHSISMLYAQENIDVKWQTLYKSIPPERRCSMFNEYVPRYDRYIDAAKNVIT